MIVYENLQKYSQFLIQSHLDGVSLAILEEGIKVDVPVLKHIMKMTPDQVFDFTRETTREFLESISSGQFYEVAASGLKRWKENALPANIDSNDIVLVDISLINAIRKKALIQYLDLYTQDITLFKDIILEMNELFRVSQTESYKAYIDMFAERLRKEENFFELVVNNTEEGIVAYDADLTITVWNKNLEKRTGIPKAEALGKNLFKIFDTIEYSPEGMALKNVLKGEKAFLKDKKIPQKDVYYEAEVLPIHSNNGQKVIGGVSISRDITERKKREEELIRSRDYYLTLLDDFPAMIWKSGLDTLYNYFNKSWLNFTGRSISQEVGNGWTEGIHPDDLQKCVDTYLANFNAKQRFSMEYRLKRFDGEYRWIVAIGQPLCDLNGEFSGFLGSCYDIHDLKAAQDKIYKMYLDIQEKNEELARAEEALRETNQQLEERISQRTEELRRQNLELKKINTDLDNFIYTASHDLKAPIANIEGLVYALQDDIDADHRSEILKLINQSILRFKSTIHDLTEISRAQKEIYTREEIRIDDILEDIKMVLQDQIENTGAVVSSRLNVPVLHFSKKNFRSILYNLVHNAIKFKSPERPVMISIASEKIDEYIVISVSDNGLGIKKENHEKIFQMFKRFHDHVEGTGVGLYIVKRIMENSDGKIEVYGNEGEGTTFKLFFKV